MKRARWINSVLPPAVVFFASMLGAEAAVRLFKVPSWLLPAPTGVLKALVNDWPTLGAALWVTTLESFAGFALSAVVGVAVAVLLSSGRWVQRAFYPYAIFFQTVPIVAIAPLMVIWLGYDLRTAAASAFIVSLFPVIANTLTGLLSTDPALRDLFRLYGASGRATLWKLKLPGAMPSILTGLRIAAGLAVIGAIVGEFFLPRGLGALMRTMLQQQRTEVVFALVLLGSFLGLAMFGLVNLISLLTLRQWHASER